MIIQAKRDRIYNALLIGMTLDDAYIYAGLTPDEIVEVTEDDQLQRQWRQVTKEFEYGLLDRMNSISRKQEKMGKEAATAWMLEKMFPRYSGKPQGDVGTININIQSQADDDSCVEVHNNDS